MGQGFSLLSLTGSHGDPPGYTPRVPSQPVNFSSANTQMPSSTAIDDFMDAAFDMSSYSMTSADDQLQQQGASVDDNEINEWKHDDHHHRSRLSSNASHHRADWRIKIAHTPHNDDVSVKVITQSSVRRNDHHNGSRINTIASSNSRQFVKKSDSRVPSVAAAAVTQHHQQHHQHQSNHRSSVVSGHQRSSQLTDNLKSNLERLLQRSLNQQSSGGRRLQSEDRRHHVAGSRQAQHGLTGGRRLADGTHRVVERSSYQSRPMTDINDLIDEDIDLQQFTPASQIDQRQSRLTDRSIVNYDDPDFDSSRLSHFQVPATISETVLRSASVLSTISRQCNTNKPVAMVQPRKVHGVRVLPTSTHDLDGDIRKSSRRPATLARSPAIRQARPYKSADQHDKQLPSIRRWKPVEYQLTDRKSDDVTSREDDHYDGNWQCRRNECNQPTPTCQEKALQWSTIGGHETLMVGQKKDAEIAALLQDIRVQGKMSSGSSRESTGSEYYGKIIEHKSLASDFEHSLGYFP